MSPRAGCLMNVFYPSPLQCRVQRYCSTPADITKEWLSGALDASVASFSTEVCQQGQCALTVLVKDLVYNGNASGRPGSLAIKMHGQTDAQRTMFSGLGHFTREIYFYTAFAGKGPLKSPKVFAVWADANARNLTGWIALPVKSRCCTCPLTTPDPGNRVLKAIGSRLPREKNQTTWES